MYPGVHAFGSSVWDDPEDVADTGPGEIRPTDWQWAGSPPNVPPGLSTPTPPEWFQFGVPRWVEGPPCVTHVSVGASVATCPQSQEVQSG